MALHPGPGPAPSPDPNVLSPAAEGNAAPQSIRDCRRFMGCMAVHTLEAAAIRAILVPSYVRREPSDDEGLPFTPGQLVMQAAQARRRHNVEPCTTADATEACPLLRDAEREDRQPTKQISQL